MNQTQELSSGIQTSCIKIGQCVQTTANTFPPRGCLQSGLLTLPRGRNPVSVLYTTSMLRGLPGHLSYKPHPTLTSLASLCPCPCVSFSHSFPAPLAWVPRTKPRGSWQPWDYGNAPRVLGIILPTGFQLHTGCGSSRKAEVGKLL